MKICLAIYKDRITTLLENTCFFRIFEYENTEQELLDAGEILLSRDCSQTSRIYALITANIDILICGGLSKTNKILFSNYKIQVFDWICGDTNQVLQAWKDNNLHNYIMPGCGKSNKSEGKTQK